MSDPNCEQCAFLKSIADEATEELEAVETALSTTGIKFPAVHCGKLFDKVRWLAQRYKVAEATIEMIQSELRKVKAHE